MGAGSLWLDRNGGIKMRIALNKRIVTDGDRVEEIIIGKSANASTVLDSVVL